MSIPFNSRIVTEDVDRVINNDLPWEEFRGKTMLVTGASGMIPSYVLYTLLALNDKKDMGMKIIALVRNRSKAEAILGDIIDRDDVEFLVQDVCEPLGYTEKIDYIFHGGSAARPALHKSSPTSTIKSNITGTFNLLDRAVKDGAKAFVLMSSSEVYGTVPEGIDKIREDCYGAVNTLDPRSCYSEGKRAAETISACYQAEFGIKVLTPRFAHIYGPGLQLNDGRVQADFAANVMRGEDIVMNSDGSSVRAYTYVGDAVAGVFYALLKGDDIAYNIADNDSIISIKELAEFFTEARPELNLKVITKIQNDSSRSYFKAKFIGLDGSKLESLGWKAAVHAKEGCTRMIRFFEEQDSEEQN